MTVKELINELLECPMDADVNVLVEVHRDVMEERLDQYSTYPFPIEDDADVEKVQVVCKGRIRIYLSNASEWY